MAPDLLGYSTTIGRGRQALASKLLTGIGLACASPHFFRRSRDLKIGEKHTAETRTRFYHQTYPWTSPRHFLPEDIAKAAEHLAPVMWLDTP
jgi:hypothetical protein